MNIDNFDDFLNNFGNSNNSSNNNVNYEEFLRGVISHHGFSTNSGDTGGFSCYIKDPDGTNDGTMLWVSRQAHSQVVTELQKYCAEQRINKVHSLGFIKDKYIQIMPQIVDKFIEEFKNYDLKFKRIGGGVGKKDNKGFFGKSGYFNYGIDFSEFSKGNYDFFKKFELFTINNSIVTTWEKINWFKCLNRDNLFVDKFFSN